MPRIFLPVEENPRTIHITGEKAHYLETVLRCREGEDLEILDGKGRSFRATITSITKKEITAEVIGAVSRNTESPLDITLIQGILKGEKMDLVIQKTTELGVSGIIPAVTERSQVRSTGKAGRWRKIAEDASRQSGRSSVPLIHEPTAFANIFSGASPSVPHSGKYGGLLFWERRGIRLKDGLGRLEGYRSLMVAVGPEGGFTAQEVELAEAHGFLVATLGSRILRAETAAFAAVTAVQVFLGDMG